MHVRLLIVQTEPKRIDEASMLFEESVIPLCKDKKGYKGAKFLADRKTGKCIFITQWESEEDMLATEQSRFFQEQVVKFIGFFTKNPIREAYEVVVED
ncbi:MAG: antibiotic biosynthesis monooxygenase [Candidatus Aminicenantes bacterium]|nr:MAG: antibiotic biosynthesis monooxygenase [Candidatus Aminicenantes bacterium]